MSTNNDPIGFLGKMNANVLMVVTPEYKLVKASGSGNAGRPEARPANLRMKPEFRTIDGTRIRFAQGGKQDGPTVLFLSPLPQSILCFDAVWARLETHCHLVALDLPGFGRSEGGLDFMNFRAQGDFVEKFVNELGLENVHVVGPDVGMAAALDYVIHHQHKAASILVGDGPGIVPSLNGSIINKAVDSGFWRMVFQVAGSGAFVGGAYLLACVNYVPNNEEVADYVASYDGRIGPVCHWFKTYPENLATVDPHLASLDLPVQVFWGDLDQFLVVENGERLDQRLPHSQLKVFKNCGHFSYQDKAQEFAKMVLDWVNGAYKAV